jgi:hypothetical protein
MRSLRALWRTSWLGALAALSIAPARGAPVPPEAPTPAIEHVADIRARLLAHDAGAAAGAPDAPPATLAQLNRRNWSNWSNWNNWLKWGKY